MSYHRPVRKADFEALRAVLSALRRQDAHRIDIEVAEYLVEAAGNLHHAAVRQNENYGPARDQLEKALNLLLAEIPPEDDGGALSNDGDTEPASED